MVSPSVWFSATWIQRSYFKSLLWQYAYKILEEVREPETRIWGCGFSDPDMHIWHCGIRTVILNDAYSGEDEHRFWLNVNSLRESVCIVHKSFQEGEAFIGPHLFELGLQRAGHTGEFELSKAIEGLWWHYLFFQVNGSYAGHGYCRDPVVELYQGKAVPATDLDAFAGWTWFVWADVILIDSSGASDTLHFAGPGRRETQTNRCGHWQHCEHPGTHLINRCGTTYTPDPRLPVELNLRAHRGTRLQSCEYSGYAEWPDIRKLCGKQGEWHQSAGFLDTGIRTTPRAHQTRYASLNIKSNTTTTHTPKRGQLAGTKRRSNHYQPCNG